MCGIVGVFNFQNPVDNNYLKNALKQLGKRGPDSNGIYTHKNCSIAQARLSIIDTSNAAKQPMTDQSGRYTIVFNGEIYNYKDIKKELLTTGITFQTESDTEVLLYAYIQKGKKCIDDFIGFFAFAIYDNVEENLFVARDRFGIKPFLYSIDGNRFAFASEMKALNEMEIDKSIDSEALLSYLQMNYIAGPKSIYSAVKKLEPAHCMWVNKDGTHRIEKYFQINYPKTSSSISYEDAKKKLYELVHESIQLRMIADVPLGAFLSGGVDSSIVVATASKYKKDLNTFSIGYKDEPYFDETKYAKIVADQFQTNHTVFSLSNEDMYEHLEDILDYIDEPFADSSAIAVYILCKMTRKKVTVALSGDGGDEVFAGYNKHHALWRSTQKNILNQLVKHSTPLWKALPKSRNGFVSNKIRQLERFGIGMQLNDAERYWRWCSFINEQEASSMLAHPTKLNQEAYQSYKKHFTSIVGTNQKIEDFLLADMSLLLPNDMLTKVDLMSMANSLEVRVPLLDHRIVDFAFSLPTSYKIDAQEKKKILKDAFRHELPAIIFDRPKHGFEVPLLKWFKGGLYTMIFDDLLDKKFVAEQNIFNVEKIEQLKKQLMSNSPGDATAQIWALIVFQKWWKKYKM